jgi:hypothetical protein
VNFAIGNILSHLFQQDLNLLLRPTQHRNVKLDTEALEALGKDRLLPEPDSLHFLVFGPRVYWIVMNMLLNIDKARFFNPLPIVPGVIESATDGLAQLLHRFGPPLQRRAFKCPVIAL